jgi:methionyl-tRNA formyltransferase
MKIYYFSSGPRERVLKALVADGIEILTVIITDPITTPRIRATVEYCKEVGIPLMTVNKSELNGLVSLVKGSVCLSVGFKYIFQEKLIHAAEVFLNVHGTLLPKYGGARTLNWVIQNGEKESGVTVHKIDKGIDTGPILLQRVFPLSKFETGKSLYRKTLEFEPLVVLDALKLYLSGKYRFMPQDKGLHEQYPNRVPEHSMIDPSLSLLDLIDSVRASDPSEYPAYFMLNGERVCIRLWRETKPDDEHDLI